MKNDNHVLSSRNFSNEQPGKSELRRAVGRQLCRRRCSRKRRSTNLEGQLEQLCATVDSHAGSALRGSTREVQRAVLRQGSVAGSKNPSAKLISRIREAEDEKLPAARKNLGRGGLAR